MTTLALREALNDAISSGRFVDTKIVLFSRRDSSGRVCKLKALYANSHVLKSVPYFKDREFPPHPSKAHEVTPFPVLFGTFSEAETRDFSGTHDDEFAEDYGYSSDSDLEEGEDFESPGATVLTPTVSLPRRQTIPCGQYEESARVGKVVRVQDVAFIT